MSVIKPRTRGKQLVRHITRLDRENNETLYAYAHFLGEPTEYVLNQLIESVLASTTSGTKAARACSRPVGQCITCSTCSAMRHFSRQVRTSTRRCAAFTNRCGISINPAPLANRLQRTPAAASGPVPESGRPAWARSPMMLDAKRNAGQPGTARVHARCPAGMRTQAGVAESIRPLFRSDGASAPPVRRCRFRAAAAALAPGRHSR